MTSTVEKPEFVRLASMVNGVRQVNQYGYLPPYGIFVEFRLLEDSGETLKGMTGSLGHMGPFNRCEPVFVVFEPNKKRVYFTDEVSHWRELVDYKDFTQAMLDFTRGCLPKVSPSE